LFDVASLRVGATERVVSLNCINRPWIPSWDSIVDRHLLVLRQRTCRQFKERDNFQVCVDIWPGFRGSGARTRRL